MSEPTDNDWARLCPECGFDIVTPDCPFCVSQYERECANAAANAAHLDRGLTPRPAWMLDRQPGDTDDCAWWRASFATFQHRAWRAWFDGGDSGMCECGHTRGKHWHRTLERECGEASCPCVGFVAASWRAWFDDGEYLGEVSARVGPDDVTCVQKCGCSQCSQQPKEQP